MGEIGGCVELKVGGIGGCVELEGGSGVCDCAGVWCAIYTCLLRNILFMVCEL